MILQILVILHLNCSEKFEYDNNGNLIKSIVSKHNDVINGGRKETTLEIMTMQEIHLKSFIYWKNIFINHYQKIIIDIYSLDHMIKTIT